MRVASRLALGVASLLLTASLFAQAVPDDDPRHALIVQATEARDAGDLRRALELARRAAAQRATPSLQLLIAQLEDGLGDLLPALDDARRCEEGLQADPSYHDWQSYFDSCHALVTALEARAGRLTVVVPGAPGAAVTVNHRVLAPEQWGVGRAVMPGYYVIDAQATGRAAFHGEIEVAAGSSQTVRVVLARMSPPVVAAPVVAAPVVVARSAGVGPWLVAGVGVASLASAGVFLALRSGALSERDAACGAATGPCAPRTDGDVVVATHAQSDAHTYNALANVALGVGGAAIVGGALWWALGRGTRAPSSIRAVVVAPSSGGAFVVFVGAL